MPPSLARTRDASSSIENIESSDSSLEFIPTKRPQHRNRPNESRTVLAARQSNFAPRNGTMLSGKGVKRRRLSHDVEDAERNKRPELNAKNAWRCGDGFSDSTPVKLDGPQFTRPSFATPARPQSRGSLFNYERQYSSEEFQDNASQATQRPRFLPTPQPSHISSGSERPVTPSSLTRPRFAHPGTTQSFSESEYTQTNASPKNDTQLTSHSYTESILHQSKNPDPWLISTTFSPRKPKNRFTNSGWANIVRRWIIEAAYNTNSSTSRTRDSGILVRVTQTPSLSHPKIPSRIKRGNNSSDVCIVRGIVVNTTTTEASNAEVNILLTHSQNSRSILDPTESLSDAAQTRGLAGKIIRLHAPVERLDLSRRPRSHGNEDTSDEVHGNGITLNDSTASGVWLICAGAFEVVPN